MKDFDNWNHSKKELDRFNKEIYAYPREIWWCSLGLNIGVETDGKNENFERPVLVMKVYNKESMIVLPLTTKEKKDKFHFEINRGVISVWVKLTQARLISNKRLLRKIDVVNKNIFDDIRKQWKNLL